MRYMGGKYRIAGEISEVINGAISRRETSNISRDCGSDEYIYNKPFVSLFCGACNVESRIKSERIICNDKHEYLIAIWQALQRGYELPDIISEEQYQYIKAHKDEDKALAGFVGFACSFGGKWFGGYVRSSNNRINYSDTGKRHTMKCFEGLRKAEFMCMDYRDVPIPDGAVIYADPPYINTTGYSCGKFDTNAFWEYMRVLSIEHLVFISEQDAPEDFVPIWEKSCRRTMANNVNNGFVATEKLFVHKSKLAELQ